MNTSDTVPWKYSPSPWHLSCFPDFSAFVWLRKECQPSLSWVIFWFFHFVSHLFFSGSTSSTICQQFSENIYYSTNWIFYFESLSESKTEYKKIRIFVFNLLSYCTHDYCISMMSLKTYVLIWLCYKRR